MSATAHDELNRLLEAAGGDPGSLTEAERARFDALLAEVADDVAKPEPDLARALDFAELDLLPTDTQWNGVWQAIQRGGKREQPALPRRSLVLRLRMPAIVGIAAALVFAITLALPRSATTSAAPIRLASDVEIHELEVSDGTPFVVSVGSNGAEVVWVLSTDG